MLKSPGQTVRKYWEIARISFKAQVVYRFESVCTALIGISRILFAYILWGAIYQGRDEIAGLTFQGMLTYYLLSAVMAQMDLANGISGEISARIRGGTFSKFMVIPAGTQGYFMAQTAGASLFYLLIHLITMGIWVGVFRVQFVLSSDWRLILAAAVMELLGLFFMMQLNYFLGILAFKFQDISFFLMIKENLVAFITGTMVPLMLLPQWLQQGMRFFPFYYVTYLPTMLLMGLRGGEAVPGVLALAGWCLLFLFVNKFLYERLRVRYDGVGI